MVGSRSLHPAGRKLQRQCGTPKQSRQTSAVRTKAGSICFRAYNNREIHSIFLSDNAAKPKDEIVVCHLLIMTRQCECSTRAIRALLCWLRTAEPNCLCSTPTPVPEFEGNSFGPASASYTDNSGQPDTKNNSEGTIGEKKNAPQKTRCGNPTCGWKRYV